MPTMKRDFRVRIALVLAGALSGCSQPSDETFGGSYDECVLKNLKQADAHARERIVESCERHFEKAPITPRKLGVGGSMTKRVDDSAEFEFRVSNDHADIIVTGFTVTVSFYTAKVSRACFLTQYSWSYRKQVSPMNDLTVYGKLSTQQFQALQSSAAISIVSFDYSCGEPAKPVFTFAAAADLQMGASGK